MRFAYLMALAACSGEAEDSAQSEPGVQILSPQDGAWADLGTEVLLEAEAWNADGSEAEVSALTWTAGPWTGEGSPLTTTELPAGTVTIVAEVEVEGQVVQDEVEISVWAR